MATEPISASLVSSLYLPGTHHSPQVYYRSKLFTSPFTTNPLLAAAGPLLSLMERLCVSPTLPTTEIIRENIEHELHAFHSRLHGHADDSDLDVIAHYLLSATIDELLSKSYLRVYNQPVEFQAFTPISQDQAGSDERFFDIVSYIKQRPSQYLDLIELSYYCLIAGFEGKYHFSANGRLALEELIEELFQLIKQYRAHKPYRLFKDQRKTEAKTKTNYKPIIGAALLSLSLLLGGYFASYALLENKVKMVQFGHTVFATIG